MAQQAPNTTVMMASTTATIVFSVSIELLPIWTFNIHAWFDQANSHTSYVWANTLHAVTFEDTKYWHVSMSLDMTTSVCVSALLPSQGAAHWYLALKDLLLDTFELSEDQRAHRLLSFTDLGGHTPSAIMDEMLSSSGNSSVDFLMFSVQKTALWLKWSAPNGSCWARNYSRPLQLFLWSNLRISQPP